MISILSVPARRLHRRTIVVQDERLARGSLFPFFDSTGRVVQLMVVHPVSNDIFMLPWDKKVVRVPLLGPIRLTYLPTINECDIGIVERLWHYDPWWVLADERFRNHWATPVLKDTNCVEDLTVHLISVWFRSDLGRLNWVWLKEGQREYTIRPWNALYLDPGRQTPVRSGTRIGARRTHSRPLRPEWQLAPIWEDGFPPRTSPTFDWRIS